MCVCVCVCVCVMRVSRKFRQRESNIEVLYIFLADERREDPNATISGTHRPAREKMTFRLHADDGPTMNAGLVVVCFFHEIRTSIAMKPNIFVFYWGVGVRITCPPLWIRTCVCVSYRPPGKSQRYMNNNKIANLYVL